MNTNEFHLSQPQSGHPFLIYGTMVCILLPEFSFVKQNVSHFFTSDIFKMCHSFHISVISCITYISLNYHDNTDTAKNGRFASYLDVFLYIDDFWTRIYNNCDYFNLLIPNFPCVSSNMVYVPLYCVYVYVHTMLTSLSEIIYSSYTQKKPYWTTVIDTTTHKLNW